MRQTSSNEHAIVPNRQAMRLIRACLLAVFILGVPCSTAQGVPTSLDVSADQRRVYLGESATLRVKVGGKDTRTPVLRAIKNCTIELVDTGRQNYEHVTIINGRRTVSGFHGTIYVYRVTPEQAGRVALGPVTIEGGGERLEAKGPIIDVIAPERQDRVILSLKPSRTKVVPDEPFNIALEIWVQVLPAPFDNAPAVHPQKPPMLTVPYLEGRETESLDQPNLREFLSPMIARNRETPGFGINHISLDNGPTMLDDLFDMTSRLSQRTARFAFDSRRARRNGKAYTVYTLNVPYKATATGSFTFGPVSLKGDTIVSVTPDGRITTKPVYVYAAACTVSAEALPSIARPATFTGGIGSQLNVTAELDTQTCNVGDPLALTLTMDGDIRLSRLRTPHLNAQTNLLRNFRVYDDTVKTETQDGRRRYQYTVRPITAGTLELPALSFAYFDTVDRTYRSVRTAPIPVRVNRLSAVDIDTVVGSSESITLTSGNGAAAGFVPAPLLILPSTSGRNAFLPRLHMALLIVGPLTYALLVLGGLAWQHVPAGQRALRRRRAAANALTTLNELTVPTEDNTVEFCTAIGCTLRTYFLERFQISAGGLTATESRMRLLAKGLPQTICAEAATVLQRVAEGEFSSIPMAVSECEQLKAEAIGVVKHLEAIS